MMNLKSLKIKLICEDCYFELKSFNSNSKMKKD
jgi:hypothetical protein